MENEYLEQINALRECRYKIRNEINHITTQIETMLNTFAFDKKVEDTMVSWDDFFDLELGKQLYVNDKISFTKYFQDDQIQKYKCYMKAGGVFGLQKHNCIERTTVVSGQLIEKTRGDKVYNVDETVIYAINEIHKPYVNIDTVLDVVFIKDLSPIVKKNSD